MGTKTAFSGTAPSRKRLENLRLRLRSLSGRLRSSTTLSYLNFIAHGTPKNAGKNNGFFSLYRLLMLELNLASETRRRPLANNNLREEGDAALEQLHNMVKIPVVLENFLFFGLLVCVNSFLTVFTLVPLKIAILAYRALCDRFSGIPWGVVAGRLAPVKRDIITVLLIVLSLFCLLAPNLDISRMYHDVRGQAHIKLYVMFGVLEVADKLLSSIGQDLLDVLYSIPILLAEGDGRRGSFVLFYMLSLIYLCGHSYILIYQTVSMNVAANSYSNALLTLLLSNQFAELKGSVFKKFDREGLFQVCMADLSERFQLSLILSIIALRNLLQLNSNYLGLIPDSWKNWNMWIGAIFGPSVVVMGSEILVDWLKHCYISKFNRVKPRVYKNFIHVLSQDYLEVFNSSPNANLLHELTDYIRLTKRIGLPLLASIVCYLRMTLPDLISVFVFPNSSFIYSAVATTVFILLAWLILICIRLILGLTLLKWAQKIKSDYHAYQNMLRSSGEIDIPVISRMGSTSPSAERSARARQSEFHTISVSTSSLDIPVPSRGSTPIFNEYSFESEENSEDRLNDLPDVPETPEAAVRPTSPTSPRSPIDLSFLPGVPNTEPSSINPTTRSYLYDFGEKVPLTVEEKRNQQLLRNTEADPAASINDVDDDLGKVMRYEMSSKRIW